MNRFAWWVDQRWDEFADHHRWFPYFPDALLRALCVLSGGHDVWTDPYGRHCRRCVQHV